MFKDYKEARNHAQFQANHLGVLYRVSLNPIFKAYHVKMVPQLRHQFGSDRDGELVEPENWPAAQKARGPGGETTTDPETAFHRARLTK